MIKFFLFLIYTTTTFFLPNNYWILILILVNFLLTLAVCVLAQSSLRKIIFGTLKFMPFILLAFLFNFWLDNLEDAIWISYKLLIVCQMTMVYASTTSNLEIAVTIQKLCAPLKFFHIDTADIKILVCISLSLVPTLRRQLSEIRLACATKHMSVNFHNIKPILMRFFTSVFARMEQIEASLLAKGYRER